MSKYTLEIRITEEDDKTNDASVVTITSYSDRVDCTWMFYPLVNALNGAGFIIDPYELTYKGHDCVELSVDSLASLSSLTD